MTQDLSPTTDDIDALIKRLCSRHPAVRAEAELALKSLTPEGVDKLVQLIRTEPKKTMRRMGLWFAVVAWPMVLGPSWLTFGHAGGLSPFWAGSLWVSFLGGYLVLFPLLVAKPRLQGTLVYCALHLDDSRVLGPLITYSLYRSPASAGLRDRVTKLFGGHTITPEQVEHALLSALRQIHTEEDVDMTATERMCLTKLLVVTKPEVAVELLNLLSIIGKTSDLRNVSIIENRAYSRSALPALREAAARCRTIIEARLNQQKIPETLLRASQSSTPSRELMRATITAAPVEEQVLLRTSQREE